MQLAAKRNFVAHGHQHRARRLGQLAGNPFLLAAREVQGMRHAPP